MLPIAVPKELVLDKLSPAVNKARPEAAINAPLSPYTCPVLASGVGVATIKRIEACKGVPSAHVKTLDQITRAMSQAGVEFVGTPDDRPGVRLKSTP